MNYKEYYETYYNYRQAKNKLHKIQNEKADVINSMMSVVSQMKDVVNHSSNSNDKMLLLTGKKIDLEAQEKLAKGLLDVREEQRKEAEDELRKSKDLKDIIYVKYYIDHIRVKDIAKQLIFARSYIYNILTPIKDFISSYDKKHKKVDKSGHKT